MTLEHAIERLNEALTKGPEVYDQAKYRFRQKFPNLYEEFEQSEYFETFEELGSK